MKKGDVEGDFKDKEIVVAVSGYFDPVHEGHIEYFRLARKLGDKLVLILNNDKQTSLKKGRPFMGEKGRRAVLEALEMIDEVVISVDEDESVCETLKKVNPDIFAKGGDRFSNEVPEAKVCEDLGIKIVDNLGDKIQSSSGLVRNFYGGDAECREWGKFFSVDKGKGYKIKRLTIEPGKRISLQKHFHRAEHWIVISGVARVMVDDDEVVLRRDEAIYVPVGVVHRIENCGRIPLEIVEVQYGEYLEEDDIERIEDDFGRIENLDFEEEFCVGPECGLGMDYDDD